MMEEAMQRNILKQVLFLLFLALMLVFLMGFWVMTSAKAAAPSENFFQNRLSWTAGDEDDDFDEDFSSRRSRRRDRWEPQVRYNRVEGVYLGMKLNRDRGRRWYPGRPTMYGFVGNAFAAKEI